VNGQKNIGLQRKQRFLRRCHESAAVMCVVAVLVLLLLLLSVMVSTEHCFVG
jgi:hypothetical protein